MTEANLRDFLSSSYKTDKNNPSYQRLNNLMFVQIPLILCGAVKLTHFSDNKVTWEDYAKQYSDGLEALVIFMFETQLDYLKGESHNNGHDLEGTSQHSDTSMLSKGVPKKKGGRPKNKQPFCPKAHATCKTNVIRRRNQTLAWFGWYEAAVQSIGEVSPEREYMKMELRMYHELQAKHLNKRVRTSKEPSSR
jgi:hypothetical protein